MAPRAGRRLIALAFIAGIAAGTALAQAQQAGEQGTGLLESECFRCHEQGGGSFGPPLRAMYAVIPPGNVSIAVGDATGYNVTIHNMWTAELQDIQATLSLADAPSLGFASGIPPAHEEREEALSGVAADERTARADFDIPAGITDLRIRLEPLQGQALLAPDVTLRLWPAPADRDDPAPISLDDAGPGGTETYHMQGGQALASLGAGAWTVEAAEAPLDLPASLVDQPLRFVVDAWTNTTGERIQVIGVAGVLDGQAPDTPQTAQVSWRLLAESRPAPDEQVTITVNLTAYYDHPGTTSGGIDEWRYTQALDVGVFEDLDVPEPPVRIDGGNQTTEPEVVEEPLPWDRIGEAVGYVSAFLLVFSMVTGGVFGKASRRGLNKLLRGAKRRVAFHNFVSYLLTFWAVVHTVIFLVEPGFPWTLGIIWGGVALLAMLLLGVTGALQIPMVRRWDYATWRWTHLGLALAAVAFTIVHLLLDGANFTEVAEAVGWSDPLQ